MLIQVYSCSNEELTPELNTGKLSDAGKIVLTQQEAEKTFSEILSKASYAEPALRGFLKNQALQRKDNDHNIFYPLSKNEIVTGNKTFIEVLESYTGYKEQLTDIESAAPLLNIFIPDLTLLDESLSIDNFDIDDSDTPIFNAGKLYWNGIVVDSLTEETSNMLPMFHTFVVNESPRRIIKKTITRSAGATIEYDFADEAYNPQNISEISTRGRKVEKTVEPEVLSELLNPENNYVKKNEFPSSTLNVFNKIGAGNGVLRPMIYYSLNKIEDINSGNLSLNYNVRDVIYRMKIDPSFYSYISKHEESSFQSPYLKPNYQYSYKGNKNRPTFDQIIKQLWSEGNYVFKINVATGDYSQLITFIISPQELFSATLRGEFKHKTAFHRRQYKWWVISGELGSKWIYPHKLKGNVDARFSAWNPMTESYKRTIFVSTAGSTTTVRREETVSNTYMKKDTGSSSSGFKISFPITTGAKGESNINLTKTWEDQYTDNKTSKVTIEVTDNDKFLGNNSFSFFGNSPILSVKDNKVYLDTERYGCFDMCIIPVDQKLY